ncbi:hypothetical protein SLEP1_g57671 [Rubroshorea leprosula]|uniref:Uncharacterized protein n=1 Tax=Rubroshorea leprosula TaxID=152421 RepID=A0AAV5MLY6_9ROSI|nr:hypothetical protein SLEP1_g57671 [Rubroshorea leprosula]
MCIMHPHPILCHLLHYYWTNRCINYCKSNLFSHWKIRRVNESISRRQTLQISQKDQSSCLTGNPIDCWKCDPDWANNLQRLADCAIGFSQYALGGKGGEYYIVMDSSDDGIVTPKSGKLRYLVI